MIEVSCWSFLFCYLADLFPLCSLALVCVGWDMRGVYLSSFLCFVLNYGCGGLVGAVRIEGLRGIVSVLFFSLL